MKHDTLTEYVDLRNALTSEKARIEERLRELNQVFGEAPAPAHDISLAISVPALATVKTDGRGWGSNAMTLKDAVLQVTSATPLSRKEIVKAVQKVGYRFSSKNPVNSLGVILYGGNPKFKSEAGKYTPVGQAANFRSKRSDVSTNTAAPSPYSTGKVKRTMGPEQKAKLAAAARKRWRAARAAGRTAL